jgi:hypothetical protein
MVRCGSQIHIVNKFFKAILLRDPAPLASLRSLLVNGPFGLGLDTVCVFRSLSSRERESKVSASLHVV